MYTLHFFPNTRAKEEKMPFPKGSKNFCPRAIHGDFFFWDTRGCNDSEKTKNIAVRTFVPQRPLFGVLRPDYYSITGHYFELGIQ